MLFFYDAVSSVELLIKSVIADGYVKLVVKRDFCPMDL